MSTTINESTTVMQVAENLVREVHKHPTNNDPSFVATLDAFVGDIHIVAKNYNGAVTVSIKTDYAGVLYVWPFAKDLNKVLEAIL